MTAGICDGLDRLGVSVVPVDVSLPQTRERALLTAAALRTRNRYDAEGAGLVNRVRSVLDEHEYRQQELVRVHGRSAILSPAIPERAAVQQAESELSGFEGDVLVLYADVPFVRAETMRAMIARGSTCVRWSLAWSSPSE